MSKLSKNEQAIIDVYQERTNRDIASARDLSQELAAAQERIRELEGAFEHLVTSGHAYDSDCQRCLDASCVFKPLTSR